MSRGRAHVTAGTVTRHYSIASQVLSTAKLLLQYPLSARYGTNTRIVGEACPAECDRAQSVQECLSSERSLTLLAWQTACHIN